MSSRRNFIKNTMLAGTALSATSSFGFNILKGIAPDDNQIIGHGDFKYKVHRDWAKMSVSQNPIFNCHEMQMDSKGRLLMIGDHTANNMFVFDKSGKLLDTWGTRYPGGHGLTLHDEGGEDVLFICDSGWGQDKEGVWFEQGGVVHKTKTDGKLIFTFPDPRTIGVYTHDMKYMPTETCVAPNGDVYIADGYGSNYVLQFNHKGEFIRKFGGMKNENPAHNLNQTHGVAIDYRDKNNPVLVCTSRNEHSFKWFTLDGKYIKTVHMPGAFVCRPVLDEGNIYAGVCWSTTREGKNWVRDTGFVTILDENNKVVSNPGGEEPVYKDGKLQQMYQAKKPTFNHGHDVFVDEDKSLYICQWNAHRTPPIKLERV
ncbi:6-bladed beta-propeller [Aquimarina sp. AD10]|uniref:6-bladed beta-propeller n=1 Tax=Aquimarina sp. AD10 TaxID=1714849 RepID=UPI000E4FCCD7|nr:6-bladed beta-propeller [Aquimarina sp. AD10]AXT60551.1 6-bladed beta-propeller [Aquimarina sp. AD10]RKN01643.1 6-bladed beta-propeller [Aquimarina sp. AD10]